MKFHLIPLLHSLRTDMSSSRVMKTLIFFFAQQIFFQNLVVLIKQVACLSKQLANLSLGALRENRDALLTLSASKCLGAPQVGNRPHSTNSTLVMCRVHTLRVAFQEIHFKIALSHNCWNVHLHHPHTYTIYIYSRLRIDGRL